MSYEHSQRRRFAVAVALTVVLVPAAFLLDRGNDDTRATTVVTVVGTVVDPQSQAEAQQPQTTPKQTDIMGTSPVDLLRDQRQSLLRIAR